MEDILEHSDGSLLVSFLDIVDVDFLFVEVVLIICGAGKCTRLGDINVIGDIR